MDPELIELSRSAFVEIRRFERHDLWHGSDCVIRLHAAVGGSSEHGVVGVAAMTVTAAWLFYRGEGEVVWEVYDEGVERDQYEAKVGSLLIAVLLQGRLGDGGRESIVVSSRT